MILCLQLLLAGLLLSLPRRLERVFGIDIETCSRCGGRLAIITSIEEPQVIAKILDHLAHTNPDRYQPEPPFGARAPPLKSSLI
jgi:hypothetical protein